MFVNIPPPDTFTKKDCHFYHTMDFPDGETVEGVWDLRGRLDDYLGGIDVEGKTLLDIGTASGFLTFEAEKRRAEVVSFDMDSPERQHLLPFEGSEYVTDWSRWVDERQKMLNKWHNAYYLAHAKNGSSARLFHGDIYTLPRALNERFDIVLLGCILEHLSNPLIAIQAAAMMSKDTLIITERLFQDSDNRIAVFQGREKSTQNNYVWWKLSRGLYEEYLAILSFEIEHISENTYPHQGRQHDQQNEAKVTTMVCRRK